MADDSTLILKILITPQFDESDVASALHISLRIGSPALPKDSTLPAFPATFAGVCTECEVKASDQSGELPVVFEDPKEADQSLERSWLTPRNTLRDSNLPGTTTGGTSGDYGFYWFGKLPPNIEAIKNIHRAFFTNARKFFDTDISKEDLGRSFFANVPEGDKNCLAEPAPHRSFVRNTGSTKCFGGTYFNHSHISNYDDQIAKVYGCDLVRRIVCKMANIWLGPSVLVVMTGGNDWFYKGKKDCCPSTCHSENRDHEHGTISIAKSELKTTRPIEDIAMIPLANNKAGGKAHSVDRWMDFLAPLMGVEIRQRYEDCYNGTTTLLLESLHGANSHYLKGLVKGLKMGSRDEIAGLKNDDKILWSSHKWRCVDDSDATIELQEVKAYEKFLEEEEKRKKQGANKAKLVTRSSIKKEKENSDA
ncbi:hypothetical protein BKA65DRAFT_569724 [Rhexocercosporidium sp. MPI-PUGE-AT-0058]|nr:hypothetical protein BKA65DRAFT_569724 [Rhexocercosporidium sp. MPI-PUGE-AT-0058]